MGVQADAQDGLAHAGPVVQRLRFLFRQQPAYAAMASHFGLVSAIAMEDTMAVLTASAGKPWAST